MSSIKNISIPEPCHQSWQQMAPESNGRHCQQCSKIVIDFTAMSNSQIIAYLSSISNVCGRFQPHQLNSVNNQLQIENTSKLKLSRWAIALSLLSTISFLKVDAQVKPLTEQTSIDAHTKYPESFPLGKIVATKTVKGHVHDYANQGLPGAQIKTDGDLVVATTDPNGDFSFEAPIYLKQILVAYIGYDSQIISLDADQNKSYNIQLQEMMLGDIVITRQPFYKRIYYKFIKRPIHKIFN